MGYVIVSVGALLCVAFVLFFVGRRSVRSGAVPQELAGARLFMSETEIACDLPVPLRGRVDQVYRDDGGELWIVDAKSRDRVFQKDVLQMSVYRTILRAKGYSVAKRAFVRSVSSGDDRFIPVDLWGDKAVIAAHARFDAIIGGVVPPRGSGNKRLCSGCAHRSVCA